MDRHEAWTALTAVALKSIEYGLPALTLPQKDCTKIMWPLLQGYLPKLGLNCHFPRDVLYGTVDKNGVGLKNIFLTQGINHICSVVTHLWQKTMTGHLIWQCGEQLHLEIGTNSRILEDDYFDIEPLILTDSWIQFTWKFCAEYDIRVKTDISTIPPRRLNNCCIMEAILQAKVATPTELKWINQCRLYLRLFHVGDMATANGTMLRKDIIKGEFDGHMHRDFLWPLWQHPPSAAWTIWRCIIRLTFTDGITLKLCQPLGNWLDFDSTKWEWFLNENNTSLFQHIGLSWSKYSKH